MKKRLMIGSLIAGVGLLGVALSVDSLVTAGLNRLGPKITQTKVTLAGARLSLVTGRGTLHGLVIANPQGWSDRDLCSIDTIHVAVAPLSVLRGHVVIREILIEAAEFNYETRLVSSNVATLLANIEAATGGRGGAPPSDAEGRSSLRVEVKRFLLRNGRVRLGVGGAGMMLPMRDIELADLGTREGGLTLHQLSLAVTKSIVASVLAATMKAVGADGRAGGAAVVEGAVESIKKVGQGVKGVKGVLDGKRPPPPTLAEVP